jgi:hypothetical protein
MAEILSTLSSDGLKGTPANGGDYYTTASSWEAAQQGVHTTNDTSVLECYADWPTGLVNSVQISGWAGTSPTSTITIRAADGQGHNGVVGAGFFLFDNASLQSIDVRENYVIIENIGVLTESSGAGRAIYASNSGNTVVRNFWAKQQAPGTSGDGIWDVWKTENCLLIGHYNSFRAKGTAGTEVSNCTVIDNVYRGYQGTGVFKNCLTYGGSTSWQVTDLGGSTNNASDGIAPPGANPITTLAAGDFVDYAGGDYNPAPSGQLDGAGVDLSGTFTDDIAGNTRSVPWEIGAYEIAAAALTFSLSPDSGPLPAGLSVNATTGNVEGTPTESGTFPNIIIRGST